jgi:hypothetical protein
VSTLRTYTIQTLDEFEAFMADLTVALIKANPAGWLVIKIGLDGLANMTRAMLPARRPKTMYIVDAPDRIVWKEDDRVFGKCVVMQIAKATS